MINGNCTGIQQIWIEIWPEPDLAGFPQNGQITDSPEPKSSTTRTTTVHSRAPIDRPISRESSGDPYLVGDRAAHPVCDH